jgi:hypothetical protein
MTQPEPGVGGRTFTVRFLVNMHEHGDRLDDTMTDLIQEIEDAVQRCRLDYTDIQIVEGNHLPYVCPRGLDGCDGTDCTWQCADCGARNCHEAFCCRCGAGPPEDDDPAAVVAGRGAADGEVTA